MDQRLDFDGGLTQCLPRLRRFAHALSRHGADADDLTQMTVERALRSRGQWQPGTRLDSWLYRIMRNLWIDTARSRARRTKVEVEDSGEDMGFDPRPAIEAAVDLDKAMQAMSRLPDEQREVVALILIEGFGYKETAEMLEMPIGTVSSRLARGRIALLQMLGEP
jgi:RNA polymerase sigma factor (sigma-70 family)